ncbi:alpha-amylase family glycosyl hydrolase [Streptomyces sp. NPDC001156]
MCALQHHEPVHAPTHSHTLLHIRKRPVPHPSPLADWLDRGVDGFRVDVAHTLFKADGLPDAGPGQHQDIHRNHLMPYYDQEELHPLFRDWRGLLDSHPAPAGAVAPGERVMAAEAGIFDPEWLARYVSPGEMQQTVNFAFLEAPWDGAAMRDVVEESVAAMQAVGAPVTRVLSSHDAVRPVTPAWPGRVPGAAALGG